MLIRVFYIPMLYNTLYKLHLKYNFPLFKRGNCFYVPILYNCVYTNYILNAISPVFESIPSHPLVLLYTPAPPKASTRWPTTLGASTNRRASSRPSISVRRLKGTIWQPGYRDPLSRIALAWQATASARSLMNQGIPTEFGGRAQ